MNTPRTSALMTALLALVALSLHAPTPAEAFCGFYVSGADAKLYNNATMVVMMRDGKRTVLSMQNNYEGPPNDFAMVVPVPVVLQKDNVKTLPTAVFDKVDTMAAPRLVEYWEQDPCYVPPPRREYRRRSGTKRSVKMKKDASKGGGKVKIEAQFKVGEYEIVILSATEAKALDTWLRQNKYNIPKGAEKVLGPYIESGMYFFVAKVDVEKVKFNAQGQAMLSPLRFHYDTDTFQLPIRLGLLNAKGDQDLLVHILARGQRYEAANYKNVTIPTNINVANEVRTRFGTYFAELFDTTLKQNPNSVVTEYAWDASTCDPCPGPNLNGNDFLTLGADVLPNKPTYGFVLTRLHARYNTSNLGEDLVFKAAPPILGGREVLINKHQAEQGAQPGNVNNFQGRYIIRHAWTGPIACQNPVRGRWGGPPAGKKNPGPVAAEDLGMVKRGGVELASLTMQDIPAIKLKATTDLANVMSGDKPDDKKPDAPADKQGDDTSGADTRHHAGLIYGMN